MQPLATHAVRRRGRPVVVLAYDGRVKEATPHELLPDDRKVGAEGTEHLEDRVELRFGVPVVRARQIRAGVVLHLRQLLEVEGSGGLNNARWRSRFL